MAINIRVLQTLLAQPTSIPWTLEEDAAAQLCGIGTRHSKYNVGGFDTPRDAALAVAAVNALPELLSENERMYAALKTVAEGFLDFSTGGASPDAAKHAGFYRGVAQAALSAVDAARSKT